MKKLLICVALMLVARYAGGCMFFTKTYDGSEDFYKSHPEYANQPDYMHPQDFDDDK